MNSKAGLRSAWVFHRADMNTTVHPRFGLGQIVRHRGAAFLGVVIDVDGAYGGDPGEPGGVTTDQPFYRILLSGDDGALLAYAAEEVLEAEPDAEDLSAADRSRLFVSDDHGHTAPRPLSLH